MKKLFQVLNIGYGTMEGTPWAKAEVLDSHIEFVNDGQRVFKGAKTAKMNISTEHEQALGLRFQNETFPAEFELELDMTIVGGKTQLKIIGFKSNLQGK